MQYTIDTNNIEMSRLLKVVRQFKSNLPMGRAEDLTNSRIREFEFQIRELKKAIGVLRKQDRSNSDYQRRDYLSG